MLYANVLFNGAGRFLFEVRNNRTVLDSDISLNLDYNEENNILVTDKKVYAGIECLVFNNI